MSKDKFGNSLKKGDFVNTKDDGVNEILENEKGELYIVVNTKLEDYPSENMVKSDKDGYLLVDREI